MTPSNELVAQNGAIGRRQKVPDSVIAILRKPLPVAAISQHPTKKYLSSIKAIYAVERLNEAFGLNGWRIRNELVEIADVKKGDKAATMVVMKSFLTVPEYGIEVEAYGGNDNEDRGDAYKGACTDALTKICSYIYIGMDVYKGLGTKQDAEVVAKQKIAAMKDNVPYTEISEPDPRRRTVDENTSVVAPDGSQIPPEAPGGSAKKPFSMAASIKAFEDLKLAMNKDLGDVVANKVYYGILGDLGFEHCNELKTAKEARAAYKRMDEAYKLALAALDDNEKNAFDEHMKQWSGNVKTVPTSQSPVG